MATPAFFVSFHRIVLVDGKKPEGVVAPAIWSEAPSSGATSAGVASGRNGDPSKLLFFRCTAAADSYVAVGPNPDEGASPRHLVKANVVTDIQCFDGDKISYVAA